MDLKTIVLVVLRRWYVVVPLAMASLIFAAVSGGEPTYTVDSSFLLVSPVSATADDGTNPLLQSRSGLNSVANVAAVVMHSTPRREAVAAAGLSDRYLFTVANLEPFVTFEVVADDPDVARESATVLAGLYVDELAEQQLRFGASAGALVRSELLEISAPDADYSAVRTKQALIAAVGLLFAFLVAFAIEGFVYVRSPQRVEFLRLFREEADSIESEREMEAGAAGPGAHPVGEGDGAPSPSPVTAVESEPSGGGGGRWSRREAVATRATRD
jgi:hypothetical protein